MSGLSHWADGWPGVAVVLLFGTACLAMSWTKADPPPAHQVAQASGRVDAVVSRRGGVYFQLRESGLQFVHSWGARGRVASELEASTAPVTVRYWHTDPDGPHMVLSIRAGDHVIVPETLVAERRQFDAGVGITIGSVFLLYGVYRVWRVRRARQLSPWRS